MPTSTQQAPIIPNKLEQSINTRLEHMQKGNKTAMINLRNEMHMEVQQIVNQPVDKLTTKQNMDMTTMLKDYMEEHTKK
eukprot:5822875-Ditylum_brightwellii.AAC.1